jgi:hypothetical protein
VISRRILPLAMVLTIALCPVALEVCQAACAEHEREAVATSASAGHHDHSAGHHDHADKTDAMAVHHHGHDAAPVTTAAGTASRIPAYERGGVPQGCLVG